jgi:HEAT repeat protein
VTALEDLVRRLGSEDVNESGLALGELIAQGKAAMPVLTQAARSESADVRALAMEGLGTIADPASLSDVRRGLEDPDGRVRSLAAVALNRLGAPDALDALLETLDDWLDEGHSDMSRSTYELAASGPRALSIAIPLLASDDWAARAKGAWIIRTIVSRNRDDPALARLEKIVTGFDARGEPADEHERAAADASRWLEDWTAQ